MESQKEEFEKAWKYVRGALAGHVIGDIEVGKKFRSYSYKKPESEERAMYVSETPAGVALLGGMGQLVVAGHHITLDFMCKSKFTADSIVELAAEFREQQDLL